MCKRCVLINSLLYLMTAHCSEFVIQFRLNRHPTMKQLQLLPGKELGNKTSKLLQYNLSCLSITVNFKPLSPN